MCFWANNGDIIGCSYFFLQERQNILVNGGENENYLSLGSLPHMKKQIFIVLLYVKI